MNDSIIRWLQGKATDADKKYLGQAVRLGKESALYAIVQAVVLRYVQSCLTDTGVNVPNEDKRNWSLLTMAGYQGVLNALDEIIAEEREIIEREKNERSQEKEEELHIADGYGEPSGSHSIIH